MYCTEGIVIKEIDHGEADRFFTIFTKDFGKIRVFGKGIRKIKAKLRGGLQLFNYIYIEFIRGKYFFTATEAVCKDYFFQIKSDGDKLKAAHFLGDLVDRLLKEEKDERIWLLVLKIFKKIEDPEFFGKKLELLICYFEWNLFDILGYHPELFKCINCREKLKEGNLFFSIINGGILCFECKNKDRGAILTSVDNLKILRLILGRKKEILQKLKINEKNDQLKMITQHFRESILGDRTNLI